MRNKKTLLFFVVLMLALSFLQGCLSKTQTKKEGYDPQIDPKDFSAKVDNKYFTLTPGKTFVYEGKTKEGTEKIVMTTLNKTKKIMGVTNVVVWDRVWSDGKLIEDTKDWYAQDKDGNVWYFGEDSKEYKNGKVTGTEGSWEAGVNGAKPGILVKADPKVGDRFRQEYLKGEAEDFSEIIALKETVTGPLGTYKNCLQTRDWTPLEPDVNEHKYYSPTVGGVVLEKVVDGDETMELVEIRKD